MTTFAEIDAGWWDFTGGGYLNHNYANGTYNAGEYAPTLRSFVAAALIELPALVSHANGYGVMGRDYDWVNTPSWYIKHGVDTGGGTYTLRGFFNVAGGTQTVDLADPILPNTKTLVAFRYTYLDAAGNTNPLEIIRVDHRGISSNTVYGSKNSNDPGPGIWLAGRSGWNNLAGKMYWAGMWCGRYNTTSATPAVSDALLLQIYNKIVIPPATSNNKFYIDFHEAIGTTYVAEHIESANASAPNEYLRTWRPYELTVTDSGSIVKGGSSDQTCLCDPHSSWTRTKREDSVGYDFSGFFLQSSDPRHTDFYPLQTNFTIVALVKREQISAGDWPAFGIWSPLLQGRYVDAGDNWTGWTFECAPDAGNGKFAFGIDGLKSVDRVYSAPTNFTNNNGIALLTVRYTYVSAGNNNICTLAAITKNNFDTGQTWNDMPPIYLPANAAHRRVGMACNLGYTAKPGYAYWIAYWNHGADPVLTNQQLFDLFTQDEHPYETLSNNLVMFADFHKRPGVGETYVTEVGNYEFTPTNTPTYYGNTGDVITDKPKVVSAAYIDDHTIRVTFDQPMATQDGDIYDPGNYTFGIPGLTPASISAVSAFVVDVTTNETIPEDTTSYIQVDNIANYKSTFYTIDPFNNQGTWTSPPPTGSTFVSEILVDEDIVWSSNTTTTNKQISINVVAYTGKHNLRFRIRRLA